AGLPPGGTPALRVGPPLHAPTHARKGWGRESTTRAGQKVPAARKEALPVMTFDESLSVHFNGEEIKAVHYPNGHTDGDGVIFFSQSNVVHMGDDLFAGMFPFVDLSSGGSVEGLVKNVGNALT